MPKCIGEDNYQLEDGWKAS